MKILRWVVLVLIIFTLLFFVLSFTSGTQPEEDFMSIRLDEIEGYFVHRDVSNDKISKADVAWQLDHILKSINNIILELESSVPEDYKINFNIPRTFVFTLGDFSRGVAQAPTSVTPPDIITDQALADQLKLARKKVASLQYLTTTSSFDHEVFGLLDRDQAARLIEVHTDHHLKIVRDILAAENIEMR